MHPFHILGPSVCFSLKLQNIPPCSAVTDSLGSMLSFRQLDGVAAANNKWVWFIEGSIALHKDILLSFQVPLIKEKSAVNDFHSERVIAAMLT